MVTYYDQWISLFKREIQKLGNYDNNQMQNIYNNVHRFCYPRGQERFSSYLDINIPNTIGQDRFTHVTHIFYEFLREMLRRGHITKQQFDQVNLNPNPHISSLMNVAEGARMGFSTPQPMKPSQVLWVV
jgi:hypothetical protein